MSNHTPKNWDWDQIEGLGSKVIANGNDKESASRSNRFVEELRSISIGNESQLGQLIVSLIFLAVKMWM